MKDIIRWGGWTALTLGTAVMLLLIAIFIDHNVYAFVDGALFVIAIAETVFFASRLVVAIQDYRSDKRWTASVDHYNYILEHPHPSETKMDTLVRASKAFVSEPKRKKVRK